MTTRTVDRRTPRTGFTLIELLLTITVIGAIVAIAVPALSGFGDEAPSDSAKRTAQIVASTAENARIAGNVEITDAEDAQAVIDLLDSGLQGRGAFEGVVFKIKLNDDQRVNVLPYLKLNPEGLVFDPNGVD